MNDWEGELVIKRPNGLRVVWVEHHVEVDVDGTSIR